MTPRAPLPLAWLTAFAAALLLLLAVVAWLLLERAGVTAIDAPAAAGVDAPGAGTVAVDDADAGAPGGFAPALAAEHERAAAVAVGPAAPASMGIEPLPEADLPLADIWDALAERADNGDAFAACRISSELMRCWRYALNRHFGTYDEQPRPGDSAATRRSIESQRRRGRTLERVCASVTPEMRRRGYRYQVIAAERGTPRMRLALALHPLLDTQRFLTDLADWNDYRARVLVYLDESLRLGERDALAALSAIHFPGRSAMGPPLYIDDDDSLLLYHTLGRRIGMLRREPMDEQVEAMRASLDPQQRLRLQRDVDALYRSHFRDSPASRREGPSLLTGMTTPEQVCTAD